MNFAQQLNAARHAIANAPRPPCAPDPRAEDTYARYKAAFDGKQRNSHQLAEILGVKPDSAYQQCLKMEVRGMVTRTAYKGLNAVYRWTEE